MPGSALPACVLALLAGCAEWPRHAHLPDEEGGLPAGTEPDLTPDVAWEHLSARGDGEDDAPRDAPVEALAEGAGNVVHGLATGSGWDFEGVAERPADCGAASGFPSEASGAYLGDVDWRVVDVPAAGVLCSSFLYLDGVTRPDVLVYELDACGVPGAALRDAEGLVIGFGGEEGENRWSLLVEGPRRLALPAVGWAPDDPEASLRYLWGLSLLAAPDDGATVRCPSVAEL